MDLTPLVSVVIPVYNAEIFLNRTIESILNQSYKNIELILVDDGSEDSSGKICDQYVLVDKRVSCIHNDNKGVSYSRNIGISKANGEYIFFVDADDYVDTDCVELLVKEALENDCQIVYCNLVIEKYRDGVIYDSFYEQIDLTKLSNKYYDDIYLLYNLNVGAVNKLLRSDIIKKNAISFPEDRSFSEDRFLMYGYYEFVKQYGFINKCMYHYCQCDKESLSKSVKLKAYQDAVFALKAEMKCYEKINCKNKNWMITKSAIFYLRHFIRCEGEKKTNFWEFRKRANEVRKIVKRRYQAFEWKEKIDASLIKFGLLFLFFLYHGIIKK